VGQIGEPLNLGTGLLGETTLIRRLVRQATAHQGPGGCMDTTTLLIIVIVLLIVGGGGWYGRRRWF
jgi:LPXTG-motif cell wall-anchored protein